MIFLIILTIILSEQLFIDFRNHVPGMGSYLQKMQQVETLTQDSIFFGYH